MENESDNHNSQELNAHSQEAVQPNTTGKTLEGTLPQEGSPLHQPAVGDNTILTDGGSYLAGSVTNEGGINQFGGTMSDVTYNDKRSYYTTPAPPLPTSSSRPNIYIPFPRNPLFQPRPGEFEELERLLFASGTGPKRLGLVGMGGVGKTQLAVELAHRYENRFPAGIFWMPAAGQQVFDWQHQLAVLAANANYLPSDDNVSSPENEGRRARYFCRYLAGHSDALLILDNVENPELVTSALSILAGGEVACSVLYTSSISSQPEGVTIHPVEQLSEEGALRLLLNETRPVLLTQIEDGQMDMEAKAAHNMFKTVGYLPLALVHLRGLLKKDQHLTLVRLYGVLTEHGALNLIQALSSTLNLSWEKVQGEEPSRLFKLACYFPEAVPIPLWLLGLASGLGEHGDILEPLGEARVQLQELSLLEDLPNKQVQLHPLASTFGRDLVTQDGDKGQALLKEAAQRLISEFTHVNKLEQRILKQDYWECLKQISAVRQYIEQLGMTDLVGQVERVERWLNRESHLLGDQRWWPNAVPGLFYQQLYNRAVEEGYPLIEGAAPARWLQ